MLVLIIPSPPVRRSDDSQAKANNKKAKSSATTPRKASSAWTETETSALAAGVAKHGAGTLLLLSHPVIIIPATLGDES